MDLVVPLVWQLATLTPFTLVAPDGTPVLEWTAEIQGPAPGETGHPAIPATGLMCPPGAAWPEPPDPAVTPIPVDPKAPLPFPRCLAFPNAGVTPAPEPPPGRDAVMAPLPPQIAALQIAGNTWRWVDPADKRLEKPALAELTWTDSANGKLVVFPPPPDPKIKPKKGEELPPPPPPVEVLVHLADVSRPTIAAAQETPDKLWKVEGATVTATLPMPPGAGTLAVLPAPEPPKPAPRPVPLKPDEQTPFEPLSTAVPGTWELAALGCDRSKIAWAWHPLLVAVPAPPLVPPKPAPKPKPGEIVVPPPVPVAQTLVYTVNGGWKAGTDDFACADQENPSVTWYGVRVQ